MIHSFHIPAVALAAALLTVTTVQAERYRLSAGSYAASLPQSYGSSNVLANDSYRRARQHIQSGPVMDNQYDDAFKAAGVDWMALKAQVSAESGFIPNAVSSAGARGLAQFMPDTAVQYLGSAQAALVPAKAIAGQGRYMQDLLRMFNNDMILALAAYNWGPGNVRRHMRNNKLTSGIEMVSKSTIPQETSRYIFRIAMLYQAIGGTGSWASGLLRSGGTATPATPVNTSGNPPAQGCAFLYPLERHYAVTSGWGMRYFVDSGKRYFRMHAGADMVSPVGVPLQASISGVVRRKGTNPGSQAGLYLEIWNPETRRSAVYMHLSKFAVLPERGRVITTGDVVSAGTVIAYSGDTGLGSAHLHFGTRLEVDANRTGSDYKYHSVDPLKYTCANAGGATFTAADKSFVSPGKRTAIDRYYAGSTADWLAASLKMASWGQDGPPPPGSMPADVAIADAGNIEDMNPGSDPLSRVLYGGGSSAMLASYDGDGGADGSFSSWLEYAVAERMAPEYYQDLAGASAERVWAELSYMATLKLFMDGAIENSRNRQSALQAAALPALSHQVLLPRAADQRKLAQGKP